MRVVTGSTTRSLGLLTAAAIASWPFVGTSGARADAGASFDATAQAIALDATATNQSLPLGLVIEGIGPEASSHMTSYGQGDAEASFPYIGPVLPGIPGIFGPLYGLPPVAYPFEATTGAGDDPKDVSGPGFALHAESGTSSTVARSNAGSESTGGTSTSRVDVDSSGNVTALAETTINAVQLAGQVSMRGVHSIAKVTADATTGKLTRKYALSVTQLYAPGLSVTVPKSTPDQIGVPVPVPGVPQLPVLHPPPVPIPPPFGGQTLPAPDIGFENGTFTVTLPGMGTQQFAIPAQPVLDAFKAVGITVTYQAPVSNATGLDGASLNVAYSVPAPPPPLNQYYSGPTPLTFSIGKVSSHVTLSPVPALDPTGGGLFGTPPFGDATGSLPPPSVSGPGGTVGTPVLSGGAPPTVAGSTPQTGSGPQLAGPGSLRNSGLLSPDFDASNIYLTFVLVAFGALGAMTLLRLLGVKTLWSS